MYDIVIDSGISVWGYSSEKHRENIAKLDGDINIFMSSYGGDVYEAIDIYNMNREYSKTKGQVTVTVGAKAMSAGAIITMSADKKKAHKNSTFMIHRAWTFAWGNAVDLENEAKILNGIDKIQAKDFSKAMGVSEEEMLTTLTTDTYYIGEDELRSINIFDEIIDSDKEDEEANQKSASKAFASSKKEFLAKVEEEEYKPDLSSAKKAILNCSDGKCPSLVNGAVPSQEKPAAKIKQKETAMADENDIQLAVAAATKSAADIAAIGSKYGIGAEAISTAISSGATVAEFQTTALDSMQERLTQASVENTEIQAKLDDAIKLGASEDDTPVQEPEDNKTEDSAVLTQADKVEV